MLNRVIWIAVICLAAGLVFRLGTDPAFDDARSTEDFWPSVGQQLSASEIRRTFGDRPLSDPGMGGRSWFLVVTPECPWCLLLDLELKAIMEAGSCTSTAIRTLVINPGGTDTDSIAAVLTKHGMQVDGMAGGEGFEVLSVRLVPLVIEVDDGLVVQRVFHPGDIDLEAEGCEVPLPR